VVGTTTLTRIIRRLRDEGIMGKGTRSSVEILDAGLLKDVTEGRRKLLRQEVTTNAAQSRCLFSEIMVWKEVLKK